MSVSSCEKPTKTWQEYTADELLQYFNRNKNNTDCSFAIFYIDTIRVMESFKWILCDMSPVIKELLEKEEKYEHIEMRDSYFDEVLDFARTKSMKYNFCIDQINLCRTAMKYKIPTMQDQAIQILHSRPASYFFVDLFELANEEFPSDERLSKLVDKAIDRFDLNEELKSKMEKASNFNYKNFNKFFDLLIWQYTDPYLCFQVAEAFIIKTLFNGAIPRPAEEQTIVERVAVNYYIDRIRFDRMSEADFKRGPAISNLLEGEHKNDRFWNAKQKHYLPQTSNVKRYYLKDELEILEQRLIFFERLQRLLNE